MNPISHFLIGWGVATAVDLNKRERAAVAVAGIIPDLDGIGIIAEKLTADSPTPLIWWTEYHHVLGHNLTFGLLVAATAFAIASHRGKTGLLALLSFHLHLLGDLVGARGPEGYQWPIPYLFPFSESPQLAWEGQWALNAWPNFLITIIALAWMFLAAARKGYSPLELVSGKADAVFVATVRKRLSRFMPGKEPGLDNDRESIV